MPSSSSSEPVSWPPPGFRRFWAGEAVSGFGTWVSLLALQTIVVVTLGGGATETGWLSTARWLPYLLIGLVVGALVDRRPRRPLMIATDLARAVLLVGIPLAWWAGILTLPLLLGIVLLFATATLVNDSASQSFVPRLVPPGQLQRAHARLDGTDAVAQTAGPALGGLLVRLVGGPVAVLVDAVSYLVSALAVATLRVAEPSPAPQPSVAPNLRREVVDGLRWVYRGGALRDLAGWTHVWFAGQAVLGAVFAPFVLRDLGLSVSWFGLVTAAAGVGGVLGAVSASAAGRRWGTGNTVVGCHVLSAAGSVMFVAATLVGSAPSAIVLLVVGQLLHGFGMGCSNSHEMAYRQSVTPDALQARTNTTMRSLNRGVVVVVAPIAGWTADQVGMLVALVAAAVFFGASAVGLGLSPFRRVRPTS